jgi:nucleotide-binding universal stress UspA family protein
MSEPTLVEPLPRKVLLATDLSARCDRALDRAAMLAKAWGSQLIALHVVEDRAALQRRSDALAPSWRRRPDPVDIAQRQLSSDLGTLDASLVTLVREGDAAETIAQTARELACELIVTGIARDETLGRFLLGTTVDRLLRKVAEPVLVVRNRPRGAYRNIVIATDFSDAAFGALLTAAAFFPASPLSLFHAYDYPRTALGDEVAIAQQFRAMAERDCHAFLERFRAGAVAAPPFRTWIEHGRPTLLLEELVHARGVDLVVLGARGRHPIAEMVLGSTATGILRELPCDALVVPSVPALVSERGA